MPARRDLHRVLIVGATGSIGRHAVNVALEQGYAVRALVREAGQSAGFPSEVECAVGDLTRVQTLAPALAGVDAIVFTHGSNGRAPGPKAVDYGAVRNVIMALGGRQARIALMTTIGATDRKGAHDWKRRGEWLVRASGLPYTVVRPSWFDYNEPDQHKLLMLQGDKALVGSPKDGVIARRQLAEVLVGSLSSQAALRKTFELHAMKGPAQTSLEPIFNALDADAPGSVHGAHDLANMPMEAEPADVLADLAAMASRQSDKAL